MKKIRLGHIGTKHDHSPGKLDCVRKFPDVFEVVGIVEDDPEQRALVRDSLLYRDYPFLTEEQLFNAGCDAVMVEGFELDLPHVALRCVQNGLPVHIDKPAGDDLAVFEQTLRLAKHKNIPVQMAYMYRYNPAVQDCLSLVREGRLGEVNSVTAVMNTAHADEKRGWLSNFRGGNMFFLGCHMVDLVYMFQGTPERVASYLKSSGFDGHTSMDQGTAIFEYPHGTTVLQANSTEIGGFERRQLVVCGSRGTYEIRPLESPIGTRFSDVDMMTATSSYASSYSSVDRQVVTTPGDSRYDDMMLDFAAMVRGEKQNPYSWDYELQVQKLVLAACGYDVDFRTQTTL